MVVEWLEGACCLAGAVRHIPFFGSVPMPLRLPATEEPLSVILKLAGDVCNINCHYCYEKRKPEREHKRIDPIMLAGFLDKAGGRPLAVELHGGEPLVVGRDHMRGLLAICREYPGDLKITLQTNGILLDDAWLDLFAEEWPDLEFSTSLDGDPIANQHRVDYQDRPTSLAVERTLRRFEARGQRIGVICTVTRPLLSRVPETLDYFLQFPAINLLKLNPCFDYDVSTRMTRGNRVSLTVLNANGAGVPGWGILPRDFLTFLTAFFDLWQERGAYMHLFVEPYMSIMRVLQGQRARFCVYDERKCAHILTLYPDGRLSSCDELPMPAGQLAEHVDDVTSIDEVLRLRTNSVLHEELDALLAKCEGCAYRDTCKGGCLATRKRYRHSEYYEEYCSYRMGIIDHVRQHLTLSPVAPT